MVLLLQLSSQVEDDSKEVSLFPNPTDGPFNVSFEGEYTEPIELVVRGIDGKVVMRKTINAEFASDRLLLDISTQAKGLYILHIQSGDFMKVIKFNKF